MSFQIENYKTMNSTDHREYEIFNSQFSIENTFEIEKISKFSISMWWKEMQSCSIDSYNFSCLKFPIKYSGTWFVSISIFTPLWCFGAPLPNTPCSDHPLLSTISIKTTKNCIILLTRLLSFFRGSSAYLRSRYGPPHLSRD